MKVNSIGINSNIRFNSGKNSKKNSYPTTCAIMTLIGGTLAFHLEADRLVRSNKRLVNAKSNLLASTVLGAAIGSFAYYIFDRFKNR